MKSGNPYARDEHDLDHATARDRWIVSYADFITLLMAFFVVMYSVSSVNTGKFRVLSNSMVTVFNKETSRAAPIDLGGGELPQDQIRVAPQSVSAMEQAISGWQSAAIHGGTVAALPAQGPPRERLEAALGPLIKRDDVRIRDSRDWLEVELASELVFGSGSAELQPQALPAIRQIAAVIIDMHKPARVEGHTDNQAIGGGRFSSNWHLSAARAATIADQLTQAKVAPERLSAVGYGEFRPLGDNATEAGRKQNRRVVIAIAKTVAAASGVTTGASKEAARTLQQISELPLPAEIGP